MYDSTKPFKAKIKELVKKTWDNNPYLEIRDGYYASFHKKHNGFEVDHTDGIGTKGVAHWLMRTFRAAAQDVLAMNVNDLALAGAKAYKTQVHLMLPADDHEAIVAIMGHLADFCANSQISITGGETSIHHNLRGMEISLTVSGVVTEQWHQPLMAQDGDRLVCIPSSGIHSNGFTLIETLFQGHYCDWMTEPTLLYDRLILEKRLPIHAAMHITGGGFTKVKDILPPYASAFFSEWEVPPCFLKIYDQYLLNYNDGLFRKELKPIETMYKTFNMGVGMVLAVAPEDAHWVAEAVGGFVGGYVHVPPGPTTSFYKQVQLSTKLSDRRIVFR